jgi:hypothetical protein
MIEGSGSEPLTNESWRPRNIRIRNTELKTIVYSIKGDRLNEHLFPNCLFQSFGPVGKACYCCSKKALKVFSVANKLPALCEGIQRITLS